MSSVITHRSTTKEDNTEVSCFSSKRRSVDSSEFLLNYCVQRRIQTWVIRYFYKHIKRYQITTEILWFFKSKNKLMEEWSFSNIFWVKFPIKLSIHQQQNCVNSVYIDGDKKYLNLLLMQIVAYQHWIYISALNVVSISLINALSRRSA